MISNHIISFSEMISYHFTGIIFIHSNGASIFHARVDSLIERFPDEVSRADRANENREMTLVLSYVCREQLQTASAFTRFKWITKKMVLLFINLLGKGLTQEISGDGALFDGLLIFPESRES